MRGESYRAYRVGAILAALVVATLSLSAQLPDTSPNEGLVRKNKVPVSNEILQIKLPKPQEIDLANGLHLMVLEDHRAPEISFQIFIPGAGGYADPADQPGLATFTASLMREGTATLRSNEIAEQLEVMAANLNVTAATASPEATIAGNALSDQFPRLLDLAADVLLHPSFPSDELARYKDRTRAALIQQRSNPTFLAEEAFARAVYGTHPAARRSATAEALDRTTRDAVVEFHRDHYVPNRAAMAIAGDISLADARTLVTAKFAEWKKLGSSVVEVSEPAPLSGSKIYLIARPSSVQTSLVVGTQAIERTNPDYERLQVMNKIIGGGPTGRLFLHLREAKGYTYGASSSLTALRHRGDWQAATQVRTEVTEPALDDLLAEIRQLSDTPVSDQELGDAKRSMVAAFALSLESPTQLVGYYVTRWRYNLAADYWDRYAASVMAVTKEQVQASAKKYLSEGRLQIVAVGDPARVSDALKKLGPVETYDADGKRTGTF